MLFIKDRDIHPAKWVLLFLMVIMYLVEIHLQDLAKRGAESAYVVSAGAVDTLLDMGQGDSTWFKLDYCDLKAQRDSASANSTYRYRKLKYALHPDLVQWGFYILPLIFLYLFGITGHLRRNQKLKDNIPESQRSATRK